MAITTEKRKYTIEDLWELSHRTDNRLELVKGALRELAPANFEHGLVAGKLQVLVGQFVMSQRLGYVVAAETGFVLSEQPATVRAPDMAYVSRERVMESHIERFADFAPDLVAEVVSPSDTFSSVAEKVEDWLNAGVRLVWVIDPATKTVRVHRAGQPTQVLHEQDTLSGEDVLPGFACKVSELFAW
jgi:Uma2 family endonuclease